MEIKIWENRIKKGITLIELSKLSGISKSTLSNFENGRTVPNLYQIEDIAIALGVRITDLIESEFL